MQRRLRLKEWILLLAPCLLLVVLGFFVRGKHPSRESIIDSIKREPVTRSEIKEGYDTKVVATVTDDGTIPQFPNRKYVGGNIEV